MSEQRRRGPMGGHGRMMSGEKAKDFKGSMAKLFRYMGRYKFRFILMFIFVRYAKASLSEKDFPRPGEDVTQVTKRGAVAWRQP